MAQHRRPPRRDLPAVKYKTKDEVLSRIVGEMAGEVSVCWTPKPEGVFDSTQARDVLERALKEIEDRFVLVLRSDHPANRVDA